MNPFEIYLLRPPGGGAPPDAILDVLLRDGRVALAAGDPSRAHYRNPDTGVFFSLLLASEVTEAWEARLAAARRAEDEYAPPPPEEAPEEEANGGRGEEEDDDPEAEEGGEAQFDVEQAPAIITVPLLVMEFFMREALAFAESAARAADLLVDLHAEAEEGTAAPSSAAIASAWLKARGDAVAELAEKGDGAFDLQVHAHHSVRVQLCAWSPAKAAAWWNYGSMCRSLAEELGPHGIVVPALKAVRHEGTVKTLCEWRPGTPCVLPRTDLVLVRREREQKGLFRARKVIEEGLVPNEQLWKILAAHSERRTEPAELLVHRSTPPQVAARLDAMALEPIEHARNALLLGVVDCEIGKGA
ncbi:MAG TPA: hypothetical protein DCM87_20350 [Planctomycetes bacterium]|nr:hypothetical protein [Planctomycetota bacterium]